VQFIKSSQKEDFLFIKRIKMKEIIIFDTTLRDGEQVPGAKLNTIEKVAVARQLEALGVDVIEAGFPISSPEDLNSVQEVAKAIKKSTVCALARGVDKDIEVAYESIKKATKPRIHTFVSASDIHIVKQMRKKHSEVIKLIENAVKKSKSYVDDVEFSPMDASRANPEFLVEVIKAAINAGATTINVPDTVGYAMPDEWGQLIKFIVKEIPAFNEDIILSVHTHNDLGFATANALMGIENGARQIEGTINGIGERAGNCANEEIIMAIKTRKNKEYKININTKELFNTSKMVSQIMGLPVQANKAIVGANAFAHSSGIHQDGIIKSRNNFEIIDPKEVGISESGIILTSRSGRGALVDKLKKMGFEFDKVSINAFYDDFLRLADRKKEITANEIKLVIAGLTEELLNDKFKLELIQAITGNKNLPTATIKIKDIEDNKTYEETRIGIGAVDAAYKAITNNIYKDAKLKEFLVQAISEGANSKGQVNVKIEYKHKEYFGFGVHDDIVVASTKAFIDAINKISLSNKTKNLDQEVNRITDITLAQTHQKDALGKYASLFSDARNSIATVLSKLNNKQKLNVMFLGSGNGSEIIDIYTKANRNITKDKIYAIERRYDAVHELKERFPFIEVVRGDYTNENVVIPDKLDLIIWGFSEHDNTIKNRLKTYTRLYEKLIKKD